MVVLFCAIEKNKKIKKMIISHLCTIHEIQLVVANVYVFDYLRCIFCIILDFV